MKRKKKGKQTMNIIIAMQVKYNNYVNITN